MHRSRELALTVVIAYALALVLSAELFMWSEFSYAFGNVAWLGTFLTVLAILVHTISAASRRALPLVTRALLVITVWWAMLHALWGIELFASVWQALRALIEANS